MTTAGAVVIALGFCWLGMVLAISFLEAPLKFRAPGVTDAVAKCSARSGNRLSRTRPQPARGHRRYR